MTTFAEDEMLEGYRDGFRAESPKPSGNRCLSYHHGFLNGRADRAGKPRGLAGDLRKQAELAILTDNRESMQ